MLKIHGNSKLHLYGDWLFLLHSFLHFFLFDNGIASLGFTYQNISMCGLERIEDHHGLIARGIEVVAPFHEHAYVI